MTALGKLRMRILTRIGMRTGAVAIGVASLALAASV